MALSVTVTFPTSYFASSSIDSGSMRPFVLMHMIRFGNSSWTSLSASNVSGFASGSPGPAMPITFT